MAKNRIGVNTILLDMPDVEENYTRDNYLRLLEHYTRFQSLIEGIEFSHVLYVSPEDASVIGKRTSELGFRPWSIHTACKSGDTAEEAETRRRQAAVCAELGCQVAVCHLPWMKEFKLQEAIDKVSRLAAETHACGVKLAVETCWRNLPDGSIVSDADDVIAVVDAINMPDVGVNIDTGHCMITHTKRNPENVQAMLDGSLPQTLPDIFRRVGHRLFTTHLQDNFGLADDHQALGLGYIDWPPVLQAIKDINYQGLLMMELTGTKAHRSVPAMRPLAVDKEIILSSNYLAFLMREAGLN